MARKLILGVGVELDHTDVKKLKTVEDVIESTIFSSLSESQQEEAAKELLLATGAEENV